MMGKARETILRLLTDGKITIEEAEELLDAISGGPPHINNEIFGKLRQKPFEHNKGQRASGFNFDFHFPWDDPNWKWPWEEDGWQWPWESSPHANRHEANPEITYHVADGANLIIKSDDGNLTIQRNDDLSNIVEDDLLKINSFSEDISSEISIDNKSVYVTLEDADVAIAIPSKVKSIQISNGDGNIKISDIKCDITLKMDDGNVMISGLEGKVYASLNDGNIVLNDIHYSDEIVVKADDGSISLNMLPPVKTGSFNLKVDDGRILLLLPSESACQVIAEVDDGAIRHNLSDWGAEILDEHEGILNAKLNGGGANFILSANDGEIAITYAGVNN